MCEGGCGLHGFCMDGICECFPGWHGTYCNYGRWQLGVVLFLVLTLAWVCLLVSSYIFRGVLVALSLWERKFSSRALMPVCLHSIVDCKRDILDHPIACSGHGGLITTSSADHFIHLLHPNLCTRNKLIRCTHLHVPTL